MYPNEPDDLQGDHVDQTPLWARTVTAALVFVFCTVAAKVFVPHITNPPKASYGIGRTVSAATLSTNDQAIDLSTSKGVPTR